MIRHDRKTQDSYIRAFEIIGEAARNPSADLRGRRPDVPWRRIISMRNRLLHGYFGVGIGVVWEAATQVLPGFRQVICQLLDGIEDER